MGYLAGQPHTAYRSPDRTPRQEALGRKGFKLDPKAPFHRPRSVESSPVDSLISPSSITGKWKPEKNMEKKT